MEKGWTIKATVVGMGIALSGSWVSWLPAQAGQPMLVRPVTTLRSTPAPKGIAPTPRRRSHLYPGRSLNRVRSPLHVTQKGIAPAVVQLSQAIPSTSVSQVDPVRPNDDRFLQPQPELAPLPADDASPLAPDALTPTPTPLPSDDTTTVSVQQIEVIGSTVFSEDDFAPLIAPVEGRLVTLAELQAVADAITQLYLDNGYLTSRAILVDQIIADGTVQIRVIEGALESIEITGNRRVNTQYVRSRVALGGRAPLNQQRLEDQLRLLRLDPLFDNVEASLRAGTGLGQSILEVRVIEADPFYGEVSIDNYSPPTVGSERLGVSAGYRSPTGLGDEISASYYRSTTGGSNVFDFNYRVPLNARNGTLQLRVSPSNYEITNPPEELEGLDIEGSAELYEISFRQPLVRSPREEFALSLGFTHRTGETLIAGFEIDSTTTSVFRLGQDYVRRDPRGAWALRSQFNIGTSLLDATTGIEPNGQFFNWFGQFQRVQILSQDHLLIAQLDVQLSPDALPDSQQFVIGGGQSLRGYRQNVRSGDSGLRLSVEDRIALLRNESGLPTLQVAPFVDAGTVWNAAENPDDELDDSFLVGLGLGVLWNPSPQLGVRLDAALPLIDLDDRGDNAQDRGIYFSVNYRF